MAIVTMKKLTLISVLSDKESIFDSLVKSACVELKRSADIDACTSSDVSAQRERLAEKIARTEEAIITTIFCISEVTRRVSIRIWTL